MEPREGLTDPGSATTLRELLLSPEWKEYLGLEEAPYPHNTHS